MRVYSVIAVILSLAVMVSGCASMSSQAKRGAGIGGILGGAAGAIIDKENRWRGGIIGATVGAIIGGTIGHIMDQAAYEAAQEGKSVEYSRTTGDGSQEIIRATPQGYSPDGEYKLVKTQLIRNGVVVKEEVKRVPVEGI